MTQLQKKGNETSFPNLLSDFFNADTFFGNRWMEKELETTIPAVNIKENEKGYSIDFAAPGFEKGDFKISVDGNILTVSAEKSIEKKDSGEKFTRKEFSYNSFSRSFTLPLTVNQDNIDARYSEGILQLQIPRKEEARANTKKEIKVA